MDILLVKKAEPELVKETAELLAEAFPHSYGDCAMEEAKKCLANERIAFMAAEGGHLAGFAGAIPQYGLTGWELHPLVVKKEFRCRGIGAMLLKALEKGCAARGGVTIYLGTDDEFNATTLSNTDLYTDTWEKISGIKNLKNHPYEFYQKAGYTIVGVIPDANGPGKPDIWMAKRISGATKYSKIAFKG